MTELTSVVANAGWSSSAISIVGTPPAKSGALGRRSARAPGPGRRRAAARACPAKASDAEHGHRAARGVVQRHRVELDEAVLDAHARVAQPGVVDHAAVVQDGALGRAGGARGVEDQRGVAGIDVRERDVGGAGQERVPVGEGDDLAQCGSSTRTPASIPAMSDPRYSGTGRRRATFDVPSTCASSRSRSAGLTVTTVMPGQARRELQDHPLRQVVGPDGDALAGLEAGEQRAGGALGLVEQLARRSMSGALACPRRAPGAPAPGRRPPAAARPR